MYAHRSQSTLGMRLGMGIATLALAWGSFLAVGSSGCGIEEGGSSSRDNARGADRRDSAAVVGRSRPAGATEAVALRGSQAEAVPGQRSARESLETAARSSDPLTFADAEQLYQRGDYRAAVRGFSDLLETDPENAWGHYWLGLALWKQRDYEPAVEALKRAAELRPDLVRAHIDLGRVLLDAGLPQAALEAARKATTLEPDDVNALRVQARCFHNLGMPGPALQAYRRVLALDPNDAWAMNNMGLIHIEGGQFTEALGPLARGAEIDPSSPTIRNNLGVALERLGCFRAAAESYRAALGADSTYAKAAASLNRVLPRASRIETEPFDLKAQAQSFVARVEAWQAELRTDAGSPVAGKR